MSLNDKLNDMVRKAQEPVKISRHPQDIKPGQDKLGFKRK